MSPEIFRYRFSSAVPLEEIEATLVLAILAVESLHGACQVRLEAVHTFDAEHRFCTIDARSLVGQDLNRLFVGFVTREFGEDAFKVHRVDADTALTVEDGENGQHKELQENHDEGTH